MCILDNSTAHKKVINGHVTITARIPIKFEVDAIDEVYENENGKEYTEEEYEYGVEEVLKQDRLTKSDIEFLKARNWTIEEIEINEC